MRFGLLLIVSWCFLGSSYGQKRLTQGFMGRKNYVQVSGNWGLIRNRAIAEHWTDYQSSNPKNYEVFKHGEISLGRAVSRKVCLELNASQVFANIQVNSRYSGAKSQGEVMYIWDGVEYNIYKRQGTATIQGYAIGLGMKRFRMELGALAPIGGYFMLQPTMNVMYFEASNVVVNKNIQGERYYAVYPVVKSTVYSLLLGCGSSRMIGRRVNVDYGLRFNLLAGYPNNISYGTHLSEKHWFEDTFAKGFSSMHNLKLRFAVGYLF